MTRSTSPATLHLPGRRPRLAIARDLLVATVCALVVAGFLFDVGSGARAPRPAATSAARLSS